MFYYRVNTRIEILTFVLLKCPELAYWKADVDRMTFGRLLLLFPPQVKNTHLIFITFYFHFLSSNNTRIQIFYFDTNTSVPLQCVVPVVWKAYVDRMSFG